MNRALAGMLTAMLVHRALTRASREDSPRTAEQVDAFVQEEMRKRRIPGLSLAVLRNGRLLRAASYGLANVELNAPATNETVYEIGPLTKAFTAAAVLLLAQEGKVGLDDPLAKYGESLPEEWGGVTLRHLLSHTSGVPTPKIDWNRSDLTAAGIAKAIFTKTPAFAPGERHEANDLNDRLLGMVIHQVSGKSYDAFLKERVFTPLGMTATRHNDGSTLVRSRASGYTWFDGAVKNAERALWRYANLAPGLPTNGAGGGLLSTIQDLTKWEAALAAGRIVSKETLARMGAPIALSDGSTAPYGLGWQIGEHRGHRVVEQGGVLPGFSARLARFVDDENLTVIVLANQEQDAQTWSLARGVAEYYEPALAPAPETEQPA